MTTPKLAPEIYARPLASFAAPGLPAVSDPGFADAVVAQVSMQYAGKGWNAAVVADSGMLRVVAVPAEGGIDPKRYLIGLLQNGYLEDAIPGLEALAGMVDDPDIHYNLGLAMSELGRVAESLGPLRRCLELDPEYHHASIALGVALAKLGQNEEAAEVLKAADRATKQKDPLVKQNLAGALARAGKFEEALPFFRQAAALAPKNPACTLGLAQCLESLGGKHAKEAIQTFKDLARRFPGTDFAERAKAVLNKQGAEDLRRPVQGGLRPDVLEYMQAAIKLFAGLPKPQVGQIVLEIARLGEQGLAINDPSRRYTLTNLQGDFSGLQLLSYMHVGMKLFDERVDTSSGLDREYEIAKGLVGR